MELVKCTCNHITLLAQLSKQLNEDEKNDDIPPIDVVKDAPMNSRGKLDGK